MRIALLYPEPRQEPGVIQNGKPLFTVHAYSLEQARALVAAKIAGETIVVAVSLARTSAVCEPLDGASR
jgi:hypothetical protein